MWCVPLGCLKCNLLVLRTVVNRSRCLFLICFPSCRMLFSSSFPDERLNVTTEFLTTCILRASLSLLEYRNALKAALGDKIPKSSWLGCFSKVRAEGDLIKSQMGIVTPRSCSPSWCSPLWSCGQVVMCMRQTVLRIW